MHGKYSIQKRVNGQVIQFGRFDSLKEAEEYRDYCIENDWSLDCKISSEHNRAANPYKHIYQNRYGYFIQKFNGVKHIYYGCFKKLEDALAHRDYCMRNDWSEECIKLNPTKNGTPRKKGVSHEYEVRERIAKMFHMRVEDIP